ncbi:MAG TPA: MoxR family ATPase [Chthonomonadaceae bacterium]|nr:MoxR family ATPase [Chthonomonadaceae bacterium]
MITKMEDSLAQVIRGKREVTRLLLIGMLAAGHILLEDVPGTGKTTLAKSLARTIEGVFHRIQFTPDLLPADILGSNVYRPADGSFEFRHGPVFANVVLADEINRASPRTQSALLEVMSESHVTIDGVERPLPQPFFVIATQNPIEFHGTYPLPEAQLDRFAVRLSLGYPSADEELEVLYSQNDSHPFDRLAAVATCDDVIALQQEVKRVRVEKTVAEYILQLVGATRKDGRLRLGVSPRGSLTLYRTAQVRAFLERREFVLPEDVRALATPVLAHRMLLDTRTKYSGALPEQIVEELLDTVPVPR